MTDENSPADVLRLHDPEALVRENESLRERLAAIEKQNVVEGRFIGEAPRYYINDPGVVLDDTHWPGGMTLDYIGAPNTSMVPLNEPAKRAMTEFLERLEDGARKVAARRGREFFGLVTDRNMLLDDALREAKEIASAPIATIQMPQPTHNIPAMPNTPEAMARAQRGPGRPRKVVGSQEAGSAKGPSPEARARAGDPNAMYPAAPGDPAILGRMVR